MKEDYKKTITYLLDKIKNTDDPDNACKWAHSVSQLLSVNPDVLEDIINES